MNKKNDNWDIEKELWNIAKEQISELENYENGKVAFLNYWKEERKFKDLIYEHLKCKYGKYFTDEVKEERESIVQQIYNSFLFKFANRFYKRTELISKRLENTIVNKNILQDIINDLKNKPDDDILNFIIEEKRKDPIKTYEKHIMNALKNPLFKNYAKNKLDKTKRKEMHMNKNDKEILATIKETLRRKLTKIK